MGIPSADEEFWAPPSWLDAHLHTDARYGRAYNALGDAGRASIKGLIARHYVLSPPVQPCCATLEQGFDTMARTRSKRPVPLVLLLTGTVHEAPAFFLAALLPALCARAHQVLALRLGTPRTVPDSLLVACELAGQERLASLGPKLLQRLLLDCAVSGTVGVVLHPDTLEFRRLLNQPALRAALDASPLRLVPLRLPRGAGLWRDAGHQFPLEDLSLLYGPMDFDTGGVHVCTAQQSRRNGSMPSEAAWRSFSAQRRDLFLVPDARAGQGGAVVEVAEACLGLWRWPQLHPSLFQIIRQAFSAAP